MARLKRYKRRNYTTPIFVETDKDDRFVLRRCITYLQKHLKKYHTLGRDTLDIICWATGNMRTEFGEIIVCCIDEPQKNKIKSQLSAYGQDHIDYSRQIEDVLEKVSPKYIKSIEQYAIQVLNKRYNNLKYQGTSKIEKNIKKIKGMFNLSDSEVRLCTFLFIITSFDLPEDYFSRHLECEKFRGRKYLCNALNISLSEINEILSSTLVKIGLIEIDRDEVRLSDDLGSLFQNPSEQVFEKKFYSKAHKDTIPLNYHFVENEQTEYLLDGLVKSMDQLSRQL